MPQDIFNDHPAGTVMENMGQSKGLNEVSGGSIKSIEKKVVQISWSELQRNVNNYVVAVKKENPEIPEAEVEMVADLLFGPFRMGQREVQGTKDVEEKRLLASIQHNIVHAVLDAARDGSSDEFTKTTYNTLSFINRLAQTDAGKDSGVYGFYAGIRGELAVVRTLLESGYHVNLPDYSQDTLEISADKDEVMQWDVVSGIDLIATRSATAGKVLLVNAESQYKSLGNTVPRLLPEVIVESDLGRIPQDVRDACRESLEENRVRKVKIIVPSAESEWDKLPAVNTPDEMKKALRNYGPKQRIKDDIIRGIQRI